MADEFAIGKALEIPDNVLKNIEKIDQKINDISKDSEIMAQKFNSAIIRMGNDSDELLKKLRAIQSVIKGIGKVDFGGLDKGGGVNNTVKQFEKISDHLVKISQSFGYLDKIKGSINPQGSVLAWQGLQKHIDNIQKKQEELLKITKQYEQTISSINSGKGGVLTKDMQDQYKAAQKEIEANKELIASYRQKQQAIIAYQQEQKKQLQYAEALKNIASGGTFADAKSAETLRRMNEYYRQLEKTSADADKKRQAEAKKAAKEIENAAKQEQKARKQAAKSAERQQQAEEKLRKSQEQKANTAAINAYNRAMASSEALVSQRINKIAKLRQAEEMLVKTGKDYSTNITKIRSEIERLNKLNQGQVDAYGRIIKSQSNLMNTSDQLMRKLALIFSVSQIQSYLIRLANVRAEFELQNTALASLLNNKDKADKLFAQITELAVKSPFTVKELVTYTKSLSAYQVEYEKLYDTTKMLADVSAGLGVDMQRLILAFGQVKAANFLRGTETRQFAEAGFNVLGELAKYYTELEGRIVSLGEVQDRQFKKMITFADVEEVFKRATSEGGLFFEMQERQAETLYGMMSNLRDSFDLMFNAIGQSNEGVLKGVVSTVRTLVENWQIFANILQASIAGFITYAAKVTIASLANGSFTKSTIAATVAQGGISAAIAKTIKAFQGMVAFAKANPFAMIASAVTFAGYQIYDHYKKVEKNKESYDSLVRSLSKAKSELKGMLSSIEEQNKAVKSTNAEVEKYKEGTNEYYEAEAKANKEREKMSKLLADISKSYPEIAEGLKLQEDGTLNVVEAQKRLNEELERSTYLTYLSRQTEGFWDDGLQTNISKATAAQLEFKKAQRDVESGWTQMNVKLKEYFATNKYANKELKKQLDDIANSSLSTGQKISKMYLLAESTSGVNIGDLRDIIYEYTDEARKSISATTDLDNVFKDLGKDIEYVANEFKAAYDVTTEEGKAKATEATEAFLRLLDIKDEAVRKFVETQFEIKIGVSLDLEGTADKQFSIMEERLNKYLKDRKFTLIPEVKEGQGLTDYFKRLNDSYKDIVAEIEKIKNASQQLYPDQTNQQRLDELNAKLIQTKTTLKDWGELVEKSTKTPRDTTLQTFKEQLSFLEKVNKKYEELQKNYNDEEAKLRVINALKEEAKQKGVESIFMSAEFDDRGTLASMNALEQQYLKIFKKLPAEMQKELAERVGGIELQLDIDVREDKVKAIQDQFSDLFGSYELSLELDKLGLDKGLMSQLFDVEAFDLSEMQKKLDAAWIEMANKQEEEDAKRENRTAKSYSNIADAVKKFGEEGAKEYAAMQKKITDAEATELQERLKRYAEYLKKSVSERVRIEQEAQKEIEKVQNTKELTKEQKIKVTAAISKETNEKLASLSFKEFKGTDLYANVFDDLERAGDLAITTLLQRLEEFKKTTGKELPVNEFKELVGVLKKVREEAESRDLFGSLVSGLKEWADSIDEVRQAEENLETIINGGSVIDSTYINENGKIVTVMKSRAKAEDELIKAQNKQKNAQTKVVNSADGIKKAYGEVADSISNALSQFQEFAEGLGAELSPEMQGLIDGMAKGFTLVGAALGIVTTAMTAATAAGTALMAVLTPLLAIGALIGGIFAISAIHDNKRQEIIDKEQDKIDRLQSSYEDLQRTIEKGNSLLKYSESSSLSKNLQAQIDSYKKMIAAERDKKKADEEQIKQWEQTIDDLTNQVADIYDNLREELVGNFKSLSEELGDAIVAAFAEGKSAAESWGMTVDEIIKNVLQQLLIQKYIEPQMEKIVDDFFKKSMPDTGLAEKAYERVEQSLNKVNELQAQWDSFDVWEKRDNVNVLKELKAAKRAYNSALTEWEKYNAAAAGEIPKITEEATNDLQQDLTGLGENFQNVIASLPDDLRKYFEGQMEGDGLTGLSREIQGVTETTAQALESLLNSVRFFTADSNTVLKQIYNAIVLPNVENPFLMEMKLQTEQLRIMNSLWSKIVKSENGSVALNVRIK